MWPHLPLILTMVTITKGGLGVPDVPALIDVCRVKWLSKIIEKGNENWKLLPRFFLGILNEPNIQKNKFLTEKGQRSLREICRTRSSIMCDQHIGEYYAKDKINKTVENIWQFFEYPIGHFNKCQLNFLF